MTLQEILAAQGMSEAAIAATLAAMKEHKIYTASEENLDGRYAKLKTNYDGLSAKHAEQETLIAQLQQNAAGNEALQGQIAERDATIQALQKENEKLRVEGAIKIGLLEAKASDVDYMTFKLKEKGEISLDENGKIKGWEDMIAGLKTQFPQQFESSSRRKVEENKLQTGEGEKNAVTKEEFEKMGYQARLDLYQNDPETYKELNNRSE